MRRPIAIFDTGIGSYAIADLIRKRAPSQEVIYLADRASFPYGGKSRAELLESVERAIRFLEGYRPSAIIVASNAPSIMVLEELRARTTTPLYGIAPPIREAVALSRTGHIGVLGVQSLVGSEEMCSFVAAEAGDAVVQLGNASPLVELVESGIFLSHPEETQHRVEDFLRNQWKLDPHIDVFTLSSTHLPWLFPFFSAASPETLFLDPAEKLVNNLLLHAEEGFAEIVGLVSENEYYPSENFRLMLEMMGVSMSLSLVELV